MSSCQIDELNREMYRLNELLSTLEALSNESVDSGVNSMVVEKFEEAKIEVLFGDGTKSATVSVENNVISVSISGKTIRIDADGTIIS